VRLNNDGLCNLVCLLDHPVLGDEDLLSGEFHGKGSACNHYTVGFMEDFFVVVKTLVVLNSSVDFGVSTMRAHSVANLLNVFSLTDEADSYDVNLTLNSELNI